MYNIVAIIGPAGSGKDSILRASVDRARELNPQINLRKIIQHTTRPMRDGEINGMDYYFVTSEDFAERVLSGDMLEATAFRDWFYGTSKSALLDNHVNIGIFNPEGIELISQSHHIALTVISIFASDKERLIRQLKREENPDIDEIIRRYKADKVDFHFLDFPYTMLSNETEEDFNSCIEIIADHLVKMDSFCLNGLQN